ncbi:MAG: hypothetical protein RBS38_01045 [Bacteroidales bacterium]|jgi:hypothetical protein|nr:hypothetical protein [Bacteroidales bacterium]
MAGDLGYGDIGCYGSAYIRTPSHHEPWNFMTSDPSKGSQTDADTFSFAFMTDIHIEYGNTALEDFRRTAEKLNNLKHDFLLTGGDNNRDARRGREL